MKSGLPMRGHSLRLPSTTTIPKAQETYEFRKRRSDFDRGLDVMNWVNFDEKQITLSRKE
jgi:hypothetical protein